MSLFLPHVEEPEELILVLEKTIENIRKCCTPPPSDPERDFDDSTEDEDSRATPKRWSEKLYRFCTGSIANDNQKRTSNRVGESEFSF